MMNIIIVGNEATEAEISAAVNGAGTSTSDIAVISDSQPTSLPVGARWIDSMGRALSGAMDEAMRDSRNETTIIADARAVTSRDLNSFANELDDSAVITYAPVDAGGELIEFPELAADQIVHLVGMYAEVPALLCAVKRSFAVERPLVGEGLAAIMTRLVVRAMSEGEEVSRSLYGITAKSSAWCALNDSQRAQILSDAINGANIEDLFPNHAWSEHHEESAAASYHSLAALFVRLGDLQTASECLRLSDQLEDSPRSLALKGLIALDRGEILGAVANMVSSLQQYENRKKNDGSHYLSFEPKDLDRINSKLQAGLQALNKRDNMTAFGHFADAVFNFDDFYRRFGVADRLKSA